MKRNFLVVFTIILSFCFIGEANAVYTDSNVGTYEQELAKFPCDYQNKIKELHKTYPNAIFVAQNTFFDWNKKKEVTVNWGDMLAAETKGTKSLIGATATSSYKTSTCAQNSSSGICSWYIASQTGVSYYLNPYNFLDSTHVFMFESQFYSSYQTEAGVEKIFAGSFMANKTCPGSNKKYSAVVTEAAQKYNISAYMLASRLRQEQGVNGTSQLISGNYSGYTGYYNYFNIGASGSTDSAVITSGLKYAKKQGWTSPYLSILGGSNFIRKEYVGINDTYNVKGQMTGYLQKWDPYGPVYAGHQYMQNIVAPYSESATTYKSYSSFSGYQNYKYIFYIPIFTGAPNTTSTSCNSNSGSNSGSSSTNPYKINGSYINGIPLGTTGTTVSNNTKGTVTDSNGKNKTSGKIATGDKVKIGNATYNVIIYGDLNGDGAIDSADLLKLRQHLIGTSKLSGVYLKSASINKDSTVDSADLLKLRQHLIGTSKIIQ